MNTIPLLAAGIAVIGTLLGVVAAQLFNRKAERERRAEERASRWLDERLRICRGLLLNAVRIERRVPDVLEFAPDNSEAAKEMYKQWTGLDAMPTKLELPGMGLLDLAVIRGALEDLRPLLAEVDILRTELSLVAQGDVVTAADVLTDNLHRIYEVLDSLSEASVCRGVYQDARRSRIAFSEWARRDLGIVVPLSPA